MLSYYYMLRRTAHSSLSMQSHSLTFPRPSSLTHTNTHIFSTCRTTDQHQLQLVTKRVESLCPKGAYWRFTDFKRGKYSFSSPIPSMQCCAAVRATNSKQQTLQLSMEGTGEGYGFFCSLKLLYLSTMPQQFCNRLQVLTWPKLHN